MLDYAIKRDELPKGITLGEYVKLKGLTEKDWLLVFDEEKSMLLTGVRADGLIGSEKDYYIVTVCNYIFPQYTSHSERPYYIVVSVSKTPINFNPIVYSETEVAENTENTFESEQPVEKNNQGVELTSLEQILFEFHQYCLERRDDYYELAKNALEEGEVVEEIQKYCSFADDEILKADFCEEIILHAGLQETYQAWLAERKKQEAVGASK